MDDERKRAIAGFLLQAAITKRGGDLIMTPTTKAELTALGIPIPPGFKVMSLADAEKSGERMTIVCETLQPPQQLVMADNLTAPCDCGCGRTIQFRPDMADTRIAKTCVFCSLERATSNEH